MSPPSSDFEAGHHHLLRAEKGTSMPDGAGEAYPGEPSKSFRRPSRGFRLAMAAALAAAAAYVAYERIGTRANADNVIHFESFGEEMVALGMTDDQPGFVLLSHLPATAVAVDAKMHENWLTGRRTTLHITTPAQSEGIRLRTPQVVLVALDGKINSVGVNWTHDDFAALAHAADCETPCQLHIHRCGRPMADMAELIRTWPESSVPTPVRNLIRSPE